MRAQIKILEAECLLKITELKSRLLTYISEDIIVAQDESLCNFEADFTDEGEHLLMNLNKNSVHTSKTFEDKKEKITL